MEGSKVLGQGNAVGDGPVGSTRSLDEIGERLGSSLGRIDELVHRARSIGDRLLGEEPATSQGQGVDAASGVVGELNLRLTHLTGLLDALDIELRRLERL